MGGAVWNAKGFKSSAVGGVGHHNDERDERYISGTNPDIDPTKTKDNYYLDGIERSPGSPSVSERIAARLATVKRKIRPDANHVIGYVVGASRDFFEGRSASDERQFFQDHVNYIARIHGRENIVSACVHKDEVKNDGLPHMHVMVVPITQDGRLSTKDFLGVPSLRKRDRDKGLKTMAQVRTEWHENVWAEWGLDRGTPLSESGAKALAPKEYKAVQDELKAVKAQIAEKMAEFPQFDLLEKISREESCGNIKKSGILGGIFKNEDDVEVKGLKWQDFQRLLVYAGKNDRIREKYDQAYSDMTKALNDAQSAQERARRAEEGERVAQAREAQATAEKQALERTLAAAHRAKDEEIKKMAQEIKEMQKKLDKVNEIGRLYDQKHPGFLDEWQKCKQDYDQKHSKGSSYDFGG